MVKLEVTSGIKSLNIYSEGLFIIKPIEPSSLCSDRSITDRLKELSFNIDGSAISNFPLVISFDSIAFFITLLS